MLIFGYSIKIIGEAIRKQKNHVANFSDEFPRFCPLFSKWPPRKLKIDHIFSNNLCMTVILVPIPMFLSFVKIKNILKYVGPTIDAQNDT